MNRDIVELRESVVKLTQLLAGKRLQVTQMGASAFVCANPRTGEPIHVNIPNVPDNADQALVTAIQGFIDHEVAHILFTDWQVKSPPEIHSLHNIVEDTFIERKMSELFPGSRTNLRRTGGFFIERISAPKIKAAIAASSDNEAFAWLIVPVVRALAGQSVFQEFLDDNGYWSHPHVAELMRQLPEDVKKRIPKANSTRETLEIARIIKAIIEPPAPAPSAPPNAQPSTTKAKPPSQPAAQQSGSADESKDANGEGEPTATKAESDETSEASGKGTPEGSDGGGEDNDAQAGDTGSGDVEDGDTAGSASGEDDGGDDDTDADDESADGASGDDGGDAAEAEEKDEDGNEADEEDEIADEGASGLDSDPENDEADRKAESETEPDDGEEESDDDTGEASSENEAEGDHDGNGASAANEAVDKGEGDGSPDEDGEEKDGETQTDGPNDASELAKSGASDKESQPGDNADTGKGSCFSPDQTIDLSGLDLSAAIAAVIGDQSAVAFLASPYSVFTRDFDVVEVHQPSGNYLDAWLPKLEDETRSMVGKMQKDVERMMAAQSRVVKVGMQRRGKLNAPALHRLLAGDDRIFAVREEHKAKNTAVSLMIDNSGSMDGIKYTSAMVAAFALASTLDRVNIPNEAIGFTTGHYARMPEAAREALVSARARGIEFHREIPIHLRIFKEFDERMNPVVKKRFADGAYAQPGKGANVDGESIEVGAVRLLKRPEHRKVMIVLSDGAPAGGHFQAIPAHLKSTVQDLSKRGIDLVGIGIMDGSVRNFYPQNVVLNNVAELPTQVMSELKRILG